MLRSRPLQPDNCDVEELTQSICIDGTGAVPDCDSAGSVDPDDVDWLDSRWIKRHIHLPAASVHGPSLLSFHLPAASGHGPSLLCSDIQRVMSDDQIADTQDLVTCRSDPDNVCFSRQDDHVLMTRSLAGRLSPD